MRLPLVTQSPERLAYDALLLALEVPALQLARMVAGRQDAADLGVVVARLRHLANLIEVHGASPV